MAREPKFPLVLMEVRGENGDIKLKFLRMEAAGIGAYGGDFPSVKLPEQRMVLDREGEGYVLREMTSNEHQEIVEIGDRYKNNKW